MCTADNVTLENLKKHKHYQFLIYRGRNFKNNEKISLDVSFQLKVYYVNDLKQRFSNCGPRTTSGPRVLPLWSF